MSAPVKNTSGSSMEVFCEIEATVTTGFEPTAMDEAIEKLEADVTIARGRIVMKVPMNKVKKVLELGCVDNCYVLMTKEKDFPFCEDELESMKHLRELVKRVDWDIGLRAWKEVFSFKHPIQHRPDVIPDVLGQPEHSSRINKPKKGDNGGKKSRRQKRREKKEKRIEEKKKKKEQNSENLESNSCTETERSEQNSNQNHFQESECSEHCGESEKIDDIDPETQSSDLSERLGYDKSETETKSESLIDNSVTDALSEPVIKKPKLTEYRPDKPAFRVTCHRTGEGHSFDSMGAQSNFGGALYNYFKWNVSMKEFDIEVMLYIDGTDVKVGLALTKHSLHRRNTTAFGPTTLRPTIAYNMLRMCKIKPGEIVCDPMCGSGVIPIQAAVDWPMSIHIAGEIVHRGLHRTVENIDFVNKENSEKEKPKINVHAIRWDACNLPFKDDTVDVFITDLPFGIRLGSKAENSTLYPRALHEMSRVAKRKTGRVCLLTQDRKGINKAMQMVSKYWKRSNACGINMGGLSACVYMMYRNMEEFDRSQPLVFPTDEASHFKGSKKSCIPKDEQSVGHEDNEKLTDN